MILEFLDLTHIPLLEGEEKLKVLSLQHNNIQKIENIVSLPNLSYLDLYDNFIKDLDGINNAFNLKILIIGKNNIQEIRSGLNLKKLEVLDLHSNKIKKISNFESLESLK